VNPSTVAAYLTGRIRPPARLIPVIAALCGPGTAEEIAGLLGVPLEAAQ
jgi:hypothetical protein